MNTTPTTIVRESANESFDNLYPPEQENNDASLRDWPAEMAPQYPPKDKSPTARDSESRVAIPNLDEASPVEQRAKSDRSHAVTNAEFIRNIFGQLPQDRNIATAHFPSVNKPSWTADFYPPEDTPDYLRENTYYSPSSFKGSKRRLDHFAALHVVVLDDITPGKLANLPAPTYALETSAENYQVGYALQSPLTDLSLANEIHQALQGAGYCDSNGNNPVRWVRLPVGMNTKPDKMFAHNLQVWEPGRRFEPAPLADLLNLKLGENERPQLSHETVPHEHTPGNNWELRMPLSSQQLADAHHMIDKAKAKGLHLSKSGNEQLWSDLACSLCFVPGGDDLFIRLSEGDSEFSKNNCLKKLKEKRRAIGRNPGIETGIAGFFSLLMAKGIANPAAGRRSTAAEDFSDADADADADADHDDTRIPCCH